MIETKPLDNGELWMMHRAVFFENIIAPTLWVFGVVSVCSLAHHDKAPVIEDSQRPVSLALPSAS